MVSGHYYFNLVNILGKKIPNKNWFKTFLYDYHQRKKIIQTVNVTMHALKYEMYIFSCKNMTRFIKSKFLSMVTPYLLMLYRLHSEFKLKI